MLTATQLCELGVDTELAKRLAADLSAQKVAGIATIGTADATDLASAVALANATKARVNQLITALKSLMASFVVRPIDGVMTLVRKDQAQPLTPRGPKSDLPCPRIVRDFNEPVQSMADGKWYTSKAGLSASYKPSGNPRGEEFVELGNEEVRSAAPEPSQAERREDLKRAMHDVVTGNLPPEIAAIE